MMTCYKICRRYCAQFITILDRSLYYTILRLYQVVIIEFLAVISDRLAPCVVRFDRHGHDCGIMSITIKYVHAKKRDESPNYDMAISII